MNTLVIFHNGEQLKDFPLQSGETILGRDDTCTILLNCTKASRKHAKIYNTGEAWVLEDLESTNGTTLNDKEISYSLLTHGDHIEIGSYTFIFEAQQESPVAGASNYTHSEHTLFLDKDVAKELFGQPIGNHQPSNYKKHWSLTDKIAYSVLSWLINRFPILHWAVNYKKKDLYGDCVAGITVAVMLIPQGMAYAMLAGLPPIMGLYASFAPLLIYAIMGTSRQLSVAPVALDSILVASGVGVIAALGSDVYVGLVILLAALVGLIQVFMGIARLGFIVNFLSYPVITGFTSAAALIIAFSQIKHILGISLPQTHLLHMIVFGVYKQFYNINIITFLLGVSSIALLMTIKRLNKKVPGAIVVVIVATFITWLFDLNNHGVNIVGQVPSGLPVPSLPDFKLESFITLLPLAVTIALIGFTEAISIAKSFAAKNQYQIIPNQELIAIGAANIVGSLFKGFPITGGFARSAVNAQAGANTGLASIISAFIIILTLLVLTPLFYYLPKSVLAAIIITAVSGLIDTKEMHYLFKVKKSEGALLVITLFATLSLGITFGLLTGIVASILLFITLNTRPNTALLGRLPNTNIFRNLDNFPQAESIPGVVILRIDASFYFANTEFLKEKLHEIVENSASTPLYAIIIDASAINDLDSSGDTALQEVVKELKGRQIYLYIAGVKGPVREVMKRSGLYDSVGADRFFFTIDAAVKRIESQQNKDESLM